LEKLGGPLYNRLEFFMTVPFYNENFVTPPFAAAHFFGVRLIGGYDIPLAYRDLAENTGVYC